MFSIIILSIIQGIAEFLPISSSAHLIIFRDIFLIGKDIITEDIKLTFDIALHLGTLLSLIVYFHKDFYKIIKEKTLLFYIIIATIPGAIFGVLFEDIIESFVRSNSLLIIISLITMGIVIYIVDISKRQNRSINDMEVKDAVIIGLSQIFSLIPGFSRSGTTITAARYLKINRVDSSKFSFYLSIPIVLGAVLLQLIKTDYNLIINNMNILILGILISFIVGLLCIRVLLGYVKNNDFKLFMVYRIILGIIVLIYFLK